MSDRDKLLDRLRLIEALYEGGATAGERAAAAAARERVQARLRQMEQTAPPIEFRFTLNNAWSRRLFVALLRRYGLRPYRYSRQRHTTVMVRVSRGFVDETLWPEFQALDEALREHLDRQTETIIQEAVNADGSEAEEVADIHVLE
jgi:hypothetical protein